MELPSVHVPSSRSREWKAICGVHDVMVSSRTKMINNVRGWLRGQARRPRDGTASTFPERVRKLELAIPLHIETELRLIDNLSEQIKASEKRLDEMASTDPVCARLMTVPGVGASTAVRFLAAIDEVGRFPVATGPVRDHFYRCHRGPLPAPPCERRPQHGSLRRGTAENCRDLRCRLMLAGGADEKGRPGGTRIAQRGHRFVAGVLWP